MDTRARTSLEQFSLMLEFMERHGDLSKPQAGPQGRIRSEQLWLELTNALNSVGGGVTRTQEKWKKVWADWKSKSKKKALVISQHARRTGGGPNSRLRLSNFEERVLSLMGPLAVEGHAYIEEQGLNALSEDHQPVQDIHEEVIIFSDGNPQSHEPVQSNQISSPTLRVHVDVPADPTSTSSQHRSATPTTSRMAAQDILSPRGRYRSRCRRTLTPFDRATSEFVAVERQRLQLEELRERNLHERETERINQQRELLDILRSGLTLFQNFIRGRDVGRNEEE